MIFRKNCTLFYKRCFHSEVTNALEMFTFLTIYLSVIIVGRHCEDWLPNIVCLQDCHLIQAVREPHWVKLIAQYINSQHLVCHAGDEASITGSNPQL